MTKTFFLNGQDTEFSLWIRKQIKGPSVVMKLQNSSRSLKIEALVLLFSIEVEWGLYYLKNIVFYWAKYEKKYDFNWEKVWFLNIKPANNHT